MKLSLRQLNRATLARQLLLQREPSTVEEALGRVLALQAQHPASPYIGLWNRLRDFDPTQLDAAYTGLGVFRSRLIRMTLHTMHPADHAAAWAAMQPSLRTRLFDSRFTSSSWTAAALDELMPALLAFTAQPRAADEVSAWLEERSGEAAKGLWWAYRYVAPLWHAPGGGPWSFGARSSYQAADSGTWSPQAASDPRLAEEGMRTLAKRYLASFGPASAADLALFAMVQRARAKQALEALEDELQRYEGPEGEVLYDLPGMPLPDPDTPAPPRLMPMWDNILLAHVDRRRTIPEDYRALAIRKNGDALPTLLVDGQVAGVWRAVDGGIEATAFHPLPRAAWDGLAAEAEDLLALLAAREPRPYSRYDHWWAQLPEGERRLLPG